MVAASTAGHGQVHTWDKCPRQICTGTATLIKKADATFKVCTLTADEIAQGSNCLAGCTAKDGKSDKAVLNKCTGTSTQLTKEIKPVAEKTVTCAFDKSTDAARPCESTCPAQCTYAGTTRKWSGKFLYGAVAAAAEQKDVACTLANARTGVGGVGVNEARLACKGYVAPTCKGETKTTQFDFNTRTTTCASKLKLCPGLSQKGCAEATGCVYAAATYTGTEKFTIPEVVKKDGTADTVCANGKNDCTQAGCTNKCKYENVDPTCTGTYKIAAVVAVAQGGASGKDKMDCALGFAAVQNKKGKMGVSADCVAISGCTFTAGTPAECKAGPSTVELTAAIAKDYTPVCDRNCASELFKNGINGDIGCAPGCTITAPAAAAVAPTPSDLKSSASAATMAAATIALSAIAAIVAL